MWATDFLETCARVAYTALLLLALDALPRALLEWLLPAGRHGKLFLGTSTVRQLWRTTSVNLHPGVHVGELTPPVLSLCMELDGSWQRVTVTSLCQPGRPLVLALGSCTSSTYLSALPALAALSSTYAGRADFVLVYVEEAHPSDGWRRDGVRHAIAQHRSLEERQRAAVTLQTELLCCGADLQRVGRAVDLMSNEASHAYGALPERLALLLDSRLVWLGERESCSVHGLQANLEVCLRQNWAAV